MAKQVIEKILCDMHESEDAVGTITYAVDGNVYEIDVCAKSKAAFDKAVAPYVERSRKVQRSARPARSSGTVRRSRATGEIALGPDPQVVRAWAAERGMDVPPKGRLPKTLVDAYIGRDASVSV